MSERRPRVAVVTFPGSLDDRDALRAVATMGGEPVAVWHGDTDLHGADAAILPGGFSYGDYLRTGAIARFAPVMRAVRDFADAGGPVLGICNGFQILCEAGLLPGALIRNRSLSFVCRWVNVRVEGEAADGEIGRGGEVLPIPIKHGEGQFVASARELDRLERRRPGRAALLLAGRRGRRRVQPERRRPQHRRRLERGRQRARDSCRTPSTRSTPTWARPAGSAILGWLLSAGPTQSRSAGMTEPLHRSLGPDRRRVRGDRQAAGARAEPRRAGHVLGDVDRALLVQVQQDAPADAPHRGTAGTGGTRSGRGRRRRRGRRRVRVQDGIALAPVGDRAVPGRRDRRRRHRTRRAVDGSAPGRAARPTPVRAAGRCPQPVPVRRRRGRHRRLRQLHRRADRRRRGAVRRVSQRRTRP